MVPSGENATDTTWSLCASVFSLSITSLPARQANRRQFWPRRGAILSSRRTRIPDFDRPVITCGHDLGAIGRKRHQVDRAAVRVSLLAQQLQFACKRSSRRQFWPRRSDLRALGAPKSQTLIVLSSDPETILVPSGENATDLMVLLWAFIFSLSISSLSARQSSRRQFWPRRGDFELAAHPNPRL